MGESDCAIVVMEPVFGGGYEIDLRRHVGAPDGGESAIGLVLRFRADHSPRLCSESGTMTEAFGGPAGEWIARLRREAPIAVALGEDRPVAAQLLRDGCPVTLPTRTGAEGCF